VKHYFKDSVKLYRQLYRPLIQGFLPYRSKRVWHYREYYPPVSTPFSAITESERFKFVLLQTATNNPSIHPICWFYIYHHFSF